MKKYTFLVAFGKEGKRRRRRGDCGRLGGALYRTNAPQRECAASEKRAVWRERALCRGNAPADSRPPAASGGQEEAAGRRNPCRYRGRPQKAGRAGLAATHAGQNGAPAAQGGPGRHGCSRAAGELAGPGRRVCEKFGRLHQTGETGGALSYGGNAARGRRRTNPRAPAFPGRLRCCARPAGKADRLPLYFARARGRK